MIVPGNAKLLLTLTTALLMLASPAWSEISLGDKGALAVGADASLEYDSNISANSTEDGDTIARLMPQVLYRYDQGVFLVDASVGVEFVEYDEQSQFDSENIKTAITVKYPTDYDGQQFSWVLDAGFEESTSADADLQSIVEREKIKFDLSGRYYIAERYFLASGLDYRDEDVLTSGFNDVRTVSVPVDLFYRYSDRLSFGFGVEYRDVSIDGPASPTADSEDIAYYLAAEGRLLSNLESEIRLGYQQRDFDSAAFDDADAFFMRAILRWFYREATTVELEANSGFRNTARNRSVEESSIELSLEHRFDEKLSSELSLEYSESDYSDLTGLQVRNDERWGVEWETSYELIEDRLDLDLILRYADQSSNIQNADYEDSLIRVALSFIY